MKKELPIAVALLATGCLLWFSQLSGPANSTGDFCLDPTQTATATQPSSNSIPADSQNRQSLSAGNADQPLASRETAGVVPASYQENEQSSQADPDEKQPGSTTASGPAENSTLNPDSYLHQVSSPQAINFLAKLSKQISNSQPLGSSIQLTGNLFGQVVSASGSYYQMGQGTHKSRIELSFGIQPNSPSFIQLCDGRFVYKLRSLSGKRSLEFVDLSRVRERAGEHGGGITPTGWVASGGIASLFQHLASGFNFGEVEPIGESGVRLRGSWDENALRQIVGLSGQPGELRANRWSRIPAQLPHAVELVFRQDENLKFFPKRIKFLKFAISDNETELKPMVVLEFSAPQPLVNVSDRHFVIDSTDLEPIDMTEQYIARIENFDQQARTAAVFETLDR